MGDVVSSLIGRLRKLAPKPETAPEPEPMPEPDTKCELDTVPEAFKNYDKNSDGLITPEEFEIQFKKQHKRPPEKQDWWIFLGNDRNGDACVSVSEYKNNF